MVPDSGTGSLARFRASREPEPSGALEVGPRSASVELCARQYPQAAGDLADFGRQAPGVLAHPLLPRVELGELGLQADGMETRSRQLQTGRDRRDLGLDALDPMPLERGGEQVLAQRREMRSQVRRENEKRPGLEQTVLGHDDALYIKPMSVRHTCGAGEASSARMAAMSRDPREDKLGRSAGSAKSVGPQGGVTTVTENRIRKTIFLDKETLRLIRADARKTRRPEAQVIREILNKHYGVSFGGDELEDD